VVLNSADEQIMHERIFTLQRRGTEEKTEVSEARQSVRAPEELLHMVTLPDEKVLETIRLMAEVDVLADPPLSQLAEPEAPERERIERDLLPHGGKRLKQEGSRVSVGTVMIRILSIVVIAAAIYIVGFKGMPVLKNYFPEIFPGGGGIVANGEGQEGANAGQAEANVPDNAGSPVGLTPAEADPAEPMAPATMTMSQTHLTLTRPGEQFTLTVTQAPAEKDELTWVSDNPAVATVTQKGVVEGLAPGGAILTATRPDGASATCEIQCTWNSQEDAPLYLNRTDFTLKVGESFHMQVVGTEAAAIWSIGNPTIATISETGAVKAVSPGQSTITAVIGEQTLTCVVRVR
jgi:hypothetical protein